MTKKVLDVEATSSKGLGTLIHQLHIANDGAAREEAQKETTKKVGRPVTNTRDITKTSQKGIKEGETRATFILQEELLEKVKAIAYWERILHKDVINTALEEYIAKYEKKSGDIKPIPEK